MGEHDARLRMASRQGDGVAPERRDAAAGVHEHHQLALGSQRHDVLHRWLGELEALGPRVQLDPRGSGVETAAGLRDRVRARVQAAERAQAALRGVGLGEHPVVRRRVAVGLVHREHERLGLAGAVERGQHLPGRAAEAVGIVVAAVRVDVEPRRTRG